MNHIQSEWEKLAAKEKADLLRGSRSYKEHYDHLMNWYVNDRKVAVPHAEVHESLKDVLEALKDLNSKVGAPELQAKAGRKGNIFTRLCA
jgi:hypothetical protein